MLFGDVRRAFHRREQVGEPHVVFGIVGERIGDEPFISDLLQPHFARPRQGMGRMNSNTDGVTVQFLEHESGQDFR